MNNPNPDDSDIDETFRRLKRAPYSIVSELIKQSNIATGQAERMLEDNGWTEEEYMAEFWKYHETPSGPQIRKPFDKPITTIRKWWQLWK